MSYRRFVRHKAAVLGLSILVIISLGAIFADLIAIEPEATFYSFDELQTKKWLPPLTDGHLMGTDDIGRDVFSRVVRGARVSLRVGFFAVGIASVAGTLIGLAAGYFGGWVDQVVSRIIDVMLAFPDLLLAIAILAALGPSLVNAMVALGLAGIPGYARVVRGRHAGPRASSSTCRRRAPWVCPTPASCSATSCRTCLSPNPDHDDPGPRRRDPRRLRARLSSAWQPTRRRRNGAASSTSRAPTCAPPGGCPRSTARQSPSRSLSVNMVGDGLREARSTRRPAHGRAKMPPPQQFFFLKQNSSR